MGLLRSGRAEGLPYSLSRWTDVSGSQNKWDWLLGALKKKEMTGFDPRTALPGQWSLKPQDTLGLVFWTKNPSNLIWNASLFRDYEIKVHMTATGWEEVEKGAPTLRESVNLLNLLVPTFGPENVTWRFSPVPLVDDVVQRFSALAAIASYAGLRSVYLSFLQENDRVPESRSEMDRLNILGQLAEVASERQIQVRLCNEDRLLAKYPDYHPNLKSSVCAPPEAFSGANSPIEACGCVLMVDPFTINESCYMSCKYCYASDKNLSNNKRNTTKSLPVIR